MKIKKGVALLLCILLVTALAGFAPASASQPASNITDASFATESAATSFAREEINQRNHIGSAHAVTAFRRCVRRGGWHSCAIFLSGFGIF